MLRYCTKKMLRYCTKKMLRYYQENVEILPRKC